MATKLKTVEVPEARSWVKMAVATAILTPITMGVVALTTSPEVVLRPIGVGGCFAMSWAVVASIFFKLRPRLLN